jgi:helicase
MVGRAGRLGYAEAGESFVIPSGSLDAGRGWSWYVDGNLEPLTSQLVPDEDPRTLMLRVLAQSQTEATGPVSEQDVIDFLDSSLAAFQAREGGSPQWTAERLRQGFEQLVTARLIEPANGLYQLTSLGRFAGESGVHVDSIVKLSAALAHIDGSSLKSTGLIAAAQITNELDGVYIAANVRAKSPEHARWWLMLQQQEVPHGLMSGMQSASDGAGALRRAKKAVAAIMWANGIQMAALESTLNQHIWNRPGLAGAVRQAIDRTRDLLPAVAAVLKELHPSSADHVTTLVERTMLRLEFGVPPEMVDMATSEVDLSRTQLLALYEAGISTAALVIDSPEDILAEVLGSQDTAENLKAACQELVEQEAATNIELPKPTE